ncbi:serine/threonine-protein kinase 11-interacting protein-like [Impatiens glandulifera]|uniref:serine/threonine-protein kinase 11-interacting protein-like n=1 Tax=Impatiens glandulifera TaxID=253017 RepID=UPI001FB09C09|nr:serine/threonine-protein kinase 11-interacting protein-like [Impatiens glandulifera]XP_047340408.1 serine/threonine-protein kinase 11-interacting protein-like [Impatiens glandulifera]
MEIVTGDRYLNSLVKFVENQAGPLIEGALVLKLNPVGLHYVQSRLESLSELESLLVGAPVDYLRAYISDLGDHRALEQLRRILRLLTSLKVVSVFPQPFRDPTPLSLSSFGRLKFLELRGCDLSISAVNGLLELRHTLEKLICHNSTAALQHVFARRISGIRGSPQWKRLSFVSCACNGLVLMDESLQLLPVVETLDLSRNNIAKVDNLLKCTRLKYLDLGFNHLRTITSFVFEASLNIVKLVLRNNALTTLRGIENLKSLEGLDISYNIISSFSEIEMVASLPSLEYLWLEGNPLCSTRSYREQVFSFFLFPDKLMLDDKKISRREVWKREIIVTSRQKRLASVGFYLPAKSDTDLGTTANPKKKKHSRLASIESEEKKTASICSDLESVTYENEIQNRDNNVISDEDAEIVGLLNNIECMKKEHSVQCLTNQDPQKLTDESNHPRHRHFGESSSHVNSDHSLDELNETASKLPTSYEDIDKKEQYREIGASSYICTDDIVQSAPLGSPPQYQEDILHRRHNLVEEFLQLSAHSFSVASSDSNSSCNDDDFDKFGASISKDDWSLIEDVTDTEVRTSLFHSEENLSGKSPNASESMQNGNLP